MQRLISDEWSANALDVFYKGVRLDNPYMLELKIESNSRAEIGSQLFDQDRPIAVLIGSRAILVSNRHGNGLSVTRVLNITGGRSVVELGPQKIERDANPMWLYCQQDDPR
ncbi:hypothetical protein [Microbacterium terrisoli]|uniref:hypothetical protein n=1 Tax=Microbacterium terrisoli TaxID=3242192 RepID=UPI002805B2C2|nr:hypothetical protein [Microbacterium protaetiae]